MKCSELHCGKDVQVPMVRHWKGVRFDFGACHYHYQYVKGVIENMLLKAESYESQEKIQVGESKDL